MKDIFCFKRGSSAYPEVFNQLTDPPQEVYVRGQIDLLSPSPHPMVGVVGTRRADAGGRRLARTVGRLLSQAGCTVVSGLALGIDAEAHQGALAADGVGNGAAAGKTLAVLGNGLDERVISPQQHLNLALQIIRSGGALLSEYPPTFPAGKYTYPARNRLIAAVCTHLVVIQAPIGSGALITVDHALTLGRSIAAFPGPAYNPSWRGSNQLLKDGAEVLCEPTDALAWLGINQQASLALENRSESIVLKLLMGGAYTTQQLIQLSGLPSKKVIQELGEAELRGKVINLNGKWSCVNKLD